MVSSDTVTKAESYSLLHEEIYRLSDQIKITSWELRSGGFMGLSPRVPLPVTQLLLIYHITSFLLHLFYKQPI